MLSRLRETVGRMTVRSKVAVVVGLLIVLSLAWMLRFDVTNAGRERGGVYVLDRWTGQLSLCVDLACFPAAPQAK